MGTLRTRLTREYGLIYPFVSAGMGFITLPPLVVAVSEAGGLGMLAGSPEPPGRLRTLIREVRQQTGRPFGVNFIAATGFLGPFTTDEHIDVCVEEAIGLVTFHWELPPSAWVERLHASGARVWMQVASVEEARAAAALAVDGLVVQGSEAGGHARSVLPLAALLPAVRDEVPGQLVMAAGGIADGAGAASALAAGADGVWVGTRLVASVEANAHPEYKRRIVAAGPGATVRTTLFGPEWPNAEMQVLRNRVVDEWVGREDEARRAPAREPIGRTVFAGQAYEMPKFSAVLPTPETEGDFEEMCLAAGGRSASTITSILPAREIVESMMAEAARVLRDRSTA